MKRLILLVQGCEPFHMTEAHLPFHTPPKRGDRSWKIVVQGAEHQVIDSYTPHRQERQRPITPFKGSWAHDMQVLRERASS